MQLISLVQQGPYPETLIEARIFAMSLCEMRKSAGFAVHGEFTDSNLTQNLPLTLSDKKFSLPGRPMLESFFNEHVIDIITNQDKYSRMGIDFPSAIVLYGHPGCGKTFAIEELANFLEWPCYKIDYRESLYS